MDRTGKFLFFLAITVFSSFTLCSGTGTIGDQCNRRKECNSTAGLRCHKGRCQCADPDAQVFSEVLGACAIKVGRRCGKSGDIQQDTTNQTSNSLAVAEDALSSLDELCVENADCRLIKLRKWCRCKESFVPSGHGTRCSPIAKYGDPCSGDGGCDKSSGTECIGGRCVCPFGEHQFFDPQLKKCISYAGGNCTTPKVSSCVKNAECVNVQLRTGYMSDDGVKKIHTKSITQCHCIKGFSETEGGLCMGTAGTECGNSQPCNSEAFLVCVDGRCKCRNPLHEMIDERTGQCVSLVGSMCSTPPAKEDNLHPLFPPCVRNSICMNSSTCGCEDGYILTPKKTCLLGYKRGCEPFQCNSHAGLACVNGTCECFDSHLGFDEVAKACVAVSKTSPNLDDKDDEQALIPFLEK